MKIKFCGVVQEVMGSVYFIMLDDGYMILLDCGLYQGSDDDMKDFNVQWLFDFVEIDCLIFFYVYIDYSGCIFKLVKDGFWGNIYCMYVICSFCVIMFLDSVKIQEYDVEYYNKWFCKKGCMDGFVEFLYMFRDVEQVWNFFEGYGYNCWFIIYDGVEVFFCDVGYILGSVFVILCIDQLGCKIFIGFIGDIGCFNCFILWDLIFMFEVDYFICEFIYGNKDYENVFNEIKCFQWIIEWICVEK